MPCFLPPICGTRAFPERCATNPSINNSITTAAHHQQQQQQQQHNMPAACKGPRKAFSRSVPAAASRHPSMAPRNAGRVRNEFPAGCLWSISTMHVGPDQPDPRPNPNPNLNPNPLGGSKLALWQGQPRGSPHVLVASTKKSGRPKGHPRPIRPTTGRKFFACFTRDA